MTADDLTGASSVVRIDLLHTMDEAQAAADLWREVWGGDQYPVQAALVLAQAHIGGYVSGAWLGDRMVAASMGLLGPAKGRVLHSHITGVIADASGKGIGSALKHHQAAWCRDHDIATITWTFDPLVARNAWFNLARLEARVVGYHVDHYGEMPDERNRGQGSDRLLVAWDAPSRPGPLTRAPGVSAGSRMREPAATPAIGGDVVVAVAVDEEGAPRVPTVPDGAGAVSVAIPTDIVALRRDDPVLAIRWRHAVRDAMADRLGRPSPRDDTFHPAGAWAVAGFDRTLGYTLSRRTT